MSAFLTQPDGGIWSKSMPRCNDEIKMYAEAQLSTDRLKKAMAE